MHGPHASLLGASRAVRCSQIGVRVITVPPCTLFRQRPLHPFRHAGHTVQGLVKACRVLASQCRSGNMPGCGRAVDAIVIGAGPPPVARLALAQARAPQLPHCTRPGRALLAPSLLPPHACAARQPCVGHPPTLAWMCTSRMALVLRTGQLWPLPCGIEHGNSLADQHARATSFATPTGMRIH